MTNNAVVIGGFGRFVFCFLYTYHVETGHASGRCIDSKARVAANQLLSAANLVELAAFFLRANGLREVCQRMLAEAALNSDFVLLELVAVEANVVGVFITGITEGDLAPITLEPVIRVVFTGFLGHLVAHVILLLVVDLAWHEFNH